MPGIDLQVREAARALWNYLRLDHSLKKCDCIIAMGSHDIRTAQHAAQLVIYDWAPLLVCSGGLGRLTSGMWQTSEAELFAEVAVGAGLPKERIILEDRSANTGENIRFTRSTLEQRGVHISSAILVHKPYMERRAVATAKKEWPALDVIASSPPIPFDKYPTPDIPLEKLIHILVGDMHRVMVYPRMGFQIPQFIPDSVMQAYHFLIKNRFTNQLVHMDASS